MESIRHIVLLHGWGCDGRIWQQALPFFDRYADTKVIDVSYIVCGEKQSIDQLCKTIVDQIPEGSVLCGWSLGGMLATRIAADYPDKVLGLITLASNLAFVEKAHWSHAMPVKTFEEFSSLFEQKPKQALKRFMLLEVHGDKKAKEQLPILQALVDDINKDDLVNGLTLLAEIDNGNCFDRIQCPALYCFGKNDALVPFSAAEAIALKCNLNQKAVVFPDVGHLLHYPEDRLSDYLAPFLSELFHRDR